MYAVLTIAVFIPGCCTPLLIFLPLKFSAPAILIWCKIIVYFGAAICGGIRVNLSGNLSKVPTPCVIVSNHQCFFETVYLQALFHPLSTVLKQSLLRIPFFGWALAILRPIAIDRSAPLQSLKQIKENGVERLQQGRNILIFPEGTRRPVGQLGDYMRSAADIAKHAKVPIVAIAHDSGRYWRHGKYSKRPGTINMVISEPITIDDRDTKETMISIQHWTQQQLDSMSTE